MDPIALQKQIRDNSSDLLDFCSDLKQWGAEMRRKEESLKSEQEINPETPLPRGIKKSKPDKENVKIVTTKRIKSCDYKAWENFDVDAECAKVDENKSDKSDDDSGELTDEFDESTRDEAVYEKEKGNKFVKNQMWDQAIDCYTKAIECYAYDPIFYANRALCYLKKMKYKEAESDCTTALQLDKTYVKAYQRRAAAREALGQLNEAHTDLLKVFDYEPNNKESRVALVKLEKKLEGVRKPIHTAKTEVVQHVKPIGQIAMEPASVKLPETKKSEEGLRPKSKFTMSRQKQKEHKLHNVNVQPEKTLNISEPVPVYWPSGYDVEIVETTHKPPHLRSKKPLKKIIIQNCETITTPLALTSKSENVVIGSNKAWPKAEIESTIIKCDELKVIERKKEGVMKDVLKKDKEEINTDKKDINRKLLEANANKELVTGEQSECDKKGIKFKFAVPETSSQFNYDWKLLKTQPESRFLYLKQVDPLNFPVIFKESLDCDVFSEIIHMLTEYFIEKSIPVYDYLLGLSQVKRFSMLTMFMSLEDKKDLWKLFNYMSSDKKLNKTNVDSLIKIYGI